MVSVPVKSLSSPPPFSVSLSGLHFFYLLSSSLRGCQAQKPAERFTERNFIIGKKERSRERDNCLYIKGNTPYSYYPCEVCEIWAHFYLLQLLPLLYTVINSACTFFASSKELEDERERDLGTFVPLDYLYIAN